MIENSTYVNLIYRRLSGFEVNGSLNNLKELLYYHAKEIGGCHDELG